MQLGPSYSVQVTFQLSSKTYINHQFLLNLQLLLEKGAMQLGGSGTVDSKTEKQQLALQALHELGAVPEHVETRTLYNDDCPGIPQVCCQSSGS